MKILITGSRKWKNMVKVFDILNKVIDKEKDTIINGGSYGVDNYATLWCKQNKVKYIIIRPIFPSKREYYLHRNAEMISMCDKCIAFWDGKSRGTKFTFTYAKKRGKETQIFKEEEEGSYDE
jgi:hypothetical protein